MPVLSGATLDEHRTFVGMMYDAVGKPFTEADYDRALRTAFGERLAGRVRDEYPTSALPSPALAWATVITDRMWARGTQALHNALGRHGPVFAYEFADRDAPMFLPLPGDFDFGACHAGDIPYLFEDEVAEPLFTPAQRRLSAAMTEYWAAFARTGTPHGAGLPAWPAHRPGIMGGRTRSHWHRGGSAPSTSTTPTTSASGTACPDTGTVVRVHASVSWSRRADAPAPHSFA